MTEISLIVTLNNQFNNNIQQLTLYHNFYPWSWSLTFSLKRWPYSKLSYQRIQVFISDMCIHCGKTFKMKLYFFYLELGGWHTFEKTLTLNITFVPEEMGISYFTCFIFVTRPFQWYLNFWPCDLYLWDWLTLEKTFVNTFKLKEMGLSYSIYIPGGKAFYLPQYPWLYFSLQPRFCHWCFSLNIVAFWQTLLSSNNSHYPMETALEGYNNNSRSCVAGWVGVSVRRALPFGHDRDYKFLHKHWKTHQFKMMRGGTLLIFVVNNERRYL